MGNLKKLEEALADHAYTFICGHCDGFLLDPYQTRCGHRLCGRCVENLFANNGDPARCPFNEEDCEMISLEGNDGSLFPDFYMRKQLKSISGACRYKESGCEETLRGDQLESHLQRDCPFAPLDCPHGCKDCMILRKDMRSQTRQCVNSCSEIIATSYKMGSHLTSCPLKPVDCPYERFGCRFKGTKDQMQDHEKSSLAHFQLMQDSCKNVKELCAENGKVMEKNFSRLSDKVNKIQSEEKASHLEMAELKLRIKILESASYDGQLIWKITDYSKQKREAQETSILSLYSQPFYTSRHGYRMCARVYLNGDGMGSGTHLSLFFVVMRGEYDALLPWPFQAKVTLMLLDQVGKTRHIIDTVRPDRFSSNFQRPTMEMNIAYGCPLFVSHSELEAKDSVFLQDDVIFIKIVVDTSGL